MMGMRSVDAIPIVAGVRLCTSLRVKRAKAESRLPGDYTGTAPGWVKPMVRSGQGSVMNSGRVGISLTLAILACTCCLPVSSQDALETELTALLKQVTDVTGYAVSLGYVDSTARTNPFKLSPWMRT
jgi:hypothetical protein